MKQAEKGQQDEMIRKAMSQINKPDRWTGGNAAGATAGGATYTVSSSTIPATYMTASAVT